MMVVDRDVGERQSAMRVEYGHMSGFLQAVGAGGCDLEPTRASLELVVCLQYYGQRTVEATVNPQCYCLVNAKSLQWRIALVISEKVWLTLFIKAILNLNFI